MANEDTGSAVLLNAMNQSMFPSTPAELLFGLLLSDDERAAQKLVSVMKGCRVVLAVTSAEADGLGALERTTVDFLLLDLPGPGLGQLAAARRLAEKAGAPLLAIAGVANDHLRVLALDNGADDCLSRPCSPRELAARLRALVRRSRGQVDPRIRHPLQLGTMVLDPATHSVRTPMKAVVLTPHEFALLTVLVTRAGRPLSRESLMSLVSGNRDRAFARSIDVHIHHLRQKIETDPHRPQLLKTVHGGGYVIIPS